jgi:hypothetical protein
VTFDREHARDVALPSACLLADRLFPHAAGTARDRLVRALTEHLMATLYAYCEFHPARADLPAPSRN